MAKTAYQKIKEKDPKQHNDAVRRKSRVDDAQRQQSQDQAGTIASGRECFAGIVPRIGELVVPTPEGAIPVRTIRRLFQDKRWDAEFVSRTKGTPWGFKLTPDKTEWRM